jgi:hypothetical protein
MLTSRPRTDRALSASTTPDRITSSSPALSPSPPPAVLPARVSALRDPNSQKRSRPVAIAAKETPTKSPRRRSAPKPEYGMEADDPAILLPRKRKRHPMELAGPHAVHPPHIAAPPDLPLKSSAYQQVREPDTAGQEVKTEMDTADPLTPPPSSSPERSLSPFHNASPSSSRSSSPSNTQNSRQYRYSQPRKIFYPPTTASGLPCLIEAAKKREEAIAEALAQQAKILARKEGLKEGKKVSRFIAREKTRTSGRLGLGLPFGLPFPAILEVRAEVRLNLFSLFCSFLFPKFWGLTVVLNHAGRELLGDHRSTRRASRHGKEKE